MQVWDDSNPGRELVFLIAKKPQESSHFSAYGVIRRKYSVEPDEFNKSIRQRFICFSGQIVFPQDKIGDANLLLDMTEVLHMHPALRRTIAQVDRSLRYLRGINVILFVFPKLIKWLNEMKSTRFHFLLTLGEEDFANPFNLEPFSLDDYIDAAVERALADDDVGVQPVQQENSSKDGKF